MKWKLSTSALLTMVSGTWALTPIRSAAQQLPAGNAPPNSAAPSPPTSPANSPAAAPAPPTTAPAYDPVALLNGSIPQATKAERNEAAERLLSRHTAEAQQALHDALVAPDVTGEIAVARALGEDSNPDRAFIDPLFPLLDNPEAAAAASRALSGYKNDPEVLTRLIDRAGERRNTADSAREEAMREAAIRAIGTIPEKRGAAVLYQLLQSPDESPPIHQAAATALANLTGLVQNGEDAARWSKWWASVRNKSDLQFRIDINALQAGRLDRLDARYDALVGEVRKLLEAEYYKTKSLPERQELMLTFLHSPEPEVRTIGISLLREDVEEGNQLSPAELQRLRDMIADSDPGVRRAVAKTIHSVNDPEALNALLAQLRVEPDPTVRTEIAAALGPIHDLRAVPTLIKLLSDDSLDTATAAAGALEDLGQDKLPTDPKQATAAAIALKDAVLAKSGTPGSDDFRAACIQALAPLKNAAVVQNLIDQKLWMSGREESPAVRSAMLVAIGALNDPKLAELIVQSLDDDPSPDVKVQAIEALKTNPRAAESAEHVGKLLEPDPVRGPKVSDAAWSFMQAIFPSLNEGQLSNRADQLRGDPGRQLIVRLALADKQLEHKELDGLAVTDSQIGEDYMALKHWGKAAASYGAALDIYDGLNVNNQQAEVQSLIARYMDALLNDPTKYADAVTLAANRIKHDPTIQHAMGRKIYEKAQTLFDSGNHDDLVGAQQLIDLASKMVPKLDDKHQGLLDELAAEIKKKASSFDNVSPVPQSATAAGK